MKQQKESKNNEICNFMYNKQQNKGNNENVTDETATCA